MKKEDWAEIGRYANEQEAYIVKGMLAENGVDAVVMSDAMQSVYPMTLTWAPVAVLVPRAQEAAAHALLAGHGE